MGGKTNLFIILLVIFNLYVILSSSFVIYIWNKYNTVNLYIIESETDNFDVSKTSLKTGLEKTAFNSFYKTINNIGARSLFDVSKEDRNIVILLGDSFIFGYGLNDNETLSYFLNQMDPSRKYINLGTSGYNIRDSVEKYIIKSKEINPPSLIIFGILDNDYYNSKAIEYRLTEEINKTHKYILWPFNIFFDKRKILIHYLEIILKKVLRDLSYERFVNYVQFPMEKLLAITDENGTKLLIINYGSVYSQELKSWCQKNRIYYFETRDFINLKKQTYFLPDRHPSVDFNRDLAKWIKNKIDELKL